MKNGYNAFYRFFEIGRLVRSFLGDLSIGQDSSIHAEQKKSPDIVLKHSIVLPNKKVEKLSKRL